MTDPKRPRRLLDGLSDVLGDLYGENAAASARLAADLNALSGKEPDTPVAKAPAELDKALFEAATTPIQLENDTDYLSQALATAKAAQAELSRLTAQLLTPDDSVPAAPAAEEAAASPAPSAPAAPAVAIKPALPSFSDLWKTADEPIDWTEALASARPTDGLTAPDKWKLYHEYAARVLHGDLEAYLTVLRAANPMGDLMPYVAALDVSTRDADHLRAVFTVRGDLLETSPRPYLSAIALRIARDLFAVLPITGVSVEARQGDKTLLTAGFERNEFSKVRFAFIDPVDFVLQCGGDFTEG